MWPLWAPRAAANRRYSTCWACSTSPTAAACNCCTETSRYSERQRAELRKRSLGFVFQSFNLIDELTVFENVELPLRYLGVGAAERRQRVEQVLEKMQLSHRRNHFPLQLSGGQ